MTPVRVSEVWPVGRRNDSRERTIAAAAELIGVHGVTGTGLRDVVDAAGTPRGSLSHHFPGGKDELVAAAVLASADRFAARLEAALEDAARGGRPLTLTETLTAFSEWWRRDLDDSGFRSGCPVVAATVDGADGAVRAAAQKAFGRWIDLITRIAAADGVPAPRDRQLATAAVAAVEGAIVLSRAARDPGPLADVEQMMLLLVDTLRAPAR